MTTDRHKAPASFSAIAIAAAALVAAAALSAGCAADRRRFAVREPLLVDPDAAPFSPKPAKFVSPEIWDTVDNLAFDPLVSTLAVEAARRAINVNSLDEVPDSSWFQNRVDELAARAALPAQDASQTADAAGPTADAGSAGAANGAAGPTGAAAWTEGPCARPPPDPAGPWTVIGGKPNGANPGFLVEHASGRRFLFKLDGGREGERPGAADVIGSRLYHAAGYNAPCNRIAFIDPKTIQLSPKATAEDFVGDKIQFTRELLDKALTRGLRTADGKLRGGLSELLDGKPIGPWTDFGTRPDDPNDVVPHQHRRELRGSYVLAALLSHYDAREQNSLDVWIATSDDGDTGFVRHYMLDFGDCLGSLSASERVSRRRSHAYELEWSVAFTELVTLGLLPRPWRDPHFGPAGATLGYYAAEPFDPERFRTAYPYGPLSRVTEADAAWGARILAAIPVSALHAIVAEARISDPVVSSAVTAALLGRREKLLRRFLGKLSPLARPRLEPSPNGAGGSGDPQLCVSDAWIEGGLAPSADRAGARKLTASITPFGKPAMTLTTLPALAAGTSVRPADSCAQLPPPATASPYAIVTLDSGPEHPLRVHLATIDGAYRIIGLVRD